MATKQLTTIPAPDGLERKKAFKTYLGFEFSAIDAVCESTILTGSKTSVSIQINEVEVEEFHQGFGTDATNDFKDISFD